MKDKSTSFPPVRDRSLLSIGRYGFHEIAYRDWGHRSTQETVLCVHGLTRNSHDFDVLASRLAGDRRVVCPDLVGRGASGWLSHPSEYHLLQYNLDATVLTARLGDKTYDWIGTSLGGLMGIALAGMRKSPIRRLIVNDIAPIVPMAALRRISSYIDSDATFDDLTQVKERLRDIYQDFGPMTDHDWAHMAQHSVQETAQGSVLGHDPAIMHNFRAYWLGVHFNLWSYWEAIDCPVLILRGTESDFLTERLLSEMLSRLPHADFLEFEDVGHTPTLNHESQIGLIVDWLNNT